MSTDHFLPPPCEVFDILESLGTSGIPKPGAARVIDVGSEGFLEFFSREILDGYIALGGSTCRFFEGVNGAGKTHLLQLIEETALEKGFITCHIELKNNLDFSRPHIITKHILEHCVAHIEGREIRRFPDILEAAKNADIIDPQRLGSVQLSHSSAQKAIQHAIRGPYISDDARKILRYYLLGEKILVKQAKDAGLVGIKKSLTEKNAEHFLNTILNSVHIMGLPGVILLYDETERSWTSDRYPIPKKVQIAANLIRRFVDACSNGDLQGTLAIFAILPNFMEECITCYPALGQRLARPDISCQSTWRWPVIQVQDSNSLFIGLDSILDEKEAFFSAAKCKFRGLVEYCDGELKGIDDEYEDFGRGELNKWANEEYRRWLIKVLSACSLDRIDSSRFSYESGHW